MLSVGGSVRMFGIATTRGGYDRQASRRVSVWTKDYLRKAAVADLGCAAVGVFVAAQLRFGSDVTRTYLTLSLALPVFWVAASGWPEAYDVRFIGTGSDEFRKVLNAGVSLTAAIAIFSYRGQPASCLAATWSSPCPASRCSTWSPGTRCASGCTGNAHQAAACSAWLRWDMSWR